MTELKSIPTAKTNTLTTPSMSEATMSPSAAEGENMLESPTLTAGNPDFFHVPTARTDSMFGKPTQTGSRRTLHKADSKKSVASSAAASERMPALISSPTAIPQFPDDQFSSVEKQIVQEINLVRADPAAYAQLLKKEHVLEGPFTKNKPLGYTKKFLNELQDQQRESDDSFQQKKTEREQEWAKRVEELQQEAATRKKGTKGKSAKKSPRGNEGKSKQPRESNRSPKPATAESGTQEDPEEVIEREGALRQKREAILEQEHIQKCSQIETHIAKLKERISSVEQCIAFLQSQQAVQSVTYSRGLSLTSRDHPLVKKQRPPKGEKQRPDMKLDARMAIYGHSMGPFAELVYVGTQSPREVLFRLLIEESMRQGCDKNSETSATSGASNTATEGVPLLLQPHFHSVGVGWGQRLNSDNAICVLTFAEIYNERKAIRARHHLPLQTIARELNFALQDPTTCITFRTYPEFGPIDVVEPTEHPVQCQARVSTVQLRVNSENVILMASFDNGNPTYQEVVFVQHQQRDVFVSVCLQQPGEQQLTVFAKRTGSLHWTSVGHILFNGKFTEKSVPRRIGFPAMYSAFSELRCFIKTPQDNPLLSNTEYVFELFAALDRKKEVANMDAESTNNFQKEVGNYQTQFEQTIKKLEEEKVTAETQYNAAMKEIEDEREQMLNPQQKNAKQRGTTPDKSKSRKKKSEIDDLLVQLKEKEETLTTQWEKKKVEMENAHTEANQTLADQMKWSQQKLDKDRRRMQVKLSQKVEVELVNNHHRVPLANSPADQEHWFKSASIKLKEGVVMMFVDGMCILKWVVV
eukprot:TRINITY_DN64309_c0_g1_i1.p1 TRINITY_DN64309_c0_g1~~TRINITY_DN64309_c0_g1_i1.p1  ORF type:complete len:810 (-),score=99.65 TRINITY_DN64309_c0_g1_i1:1055-3484(-)